MRRALAERDQARKFQAATGQILKVMRDSPADAQPVFETIVRNAVTLCGGFFASAFRFDGTRLHLVATTIDDPAAREFQASQYPRQPDTTQMSGRAIRARAVVRMEDALADPGYDRRHSQVGSWRRMLGVPMLKRGEPIGVIVVAWADPGRIPKHEEQLLTSFADHAVIAIENVRLFNDTKEALEQQTATAEVLKVISGSPTDVAPVFDAILRSAVMLCGAELAAMFAFDGRLVHMVGTYNWPDEAVEYFSKIYPSPPSPKLLSGRTILSKSVVKIADSAADPNYDPNSVLTGHWRRMLGAPMLREGRPLGALIVSWRDPGETPQRQVDLLQTFADQAAIAVENVRLFNETKEALEQQKASADVLSVISSSIADAHPVFEKILESCERLFAGRVVGINVLGQDGMIHIGAYHGPGRDAFEKVFPLRVDRDSGSGLAIVERRVVHIPDSEAEGVPEAARRGNRARGNRASLYAPMMWRNEAIGVVWVSRELPGPFSEKEISLLKTFADQAVIAIQNARLFREIQEKSAQLEVANKHKSDFLANMSHELRTPLNAIIGFSEVLTERMFGEVNEKQAEYLKDIHESGRHLLSLINDILDLSKIEAGRMELELSAFHLPTAVANAMTLVRERAQRHGIALGAEIDPALGAVEGDERKVKQILLNLLSNAVKFTPDGGRVDVRAKAADGRIEIEVRDTGIGIAAEDQAAVFEEFKQVGRDYTRKAEGTGLGLALTRRLVELHGGDIALESAPGKGSTFTVRLPLR